jgi:hypothetical protein
MPPPLVWGPVGAAHRNVSAAVETELQADPREVPGGQSITDVGWSGVKRLRIMGLADRESE